MDRATAITPERIASELDGLIPEPVRLEPVMSERVTFCCAFTTGRTEYGPGSFNQT